MNATEIADALAEWVEATCPEFTDSTYDHDPKELTTPMPNLAVWTASENVGPSDVTLGVPWATFGIDQAVVRTTRATLWILVKPEPVAEAAEELQNLVDALGSAILAEADGGGMVTLGGRVPAASPFWDVSYEPPYAPLDDGSKARVAQFSLAVAELV